MKNYEPSIGTRMGTAAKAKQALLEKARQIKAADDPATIKRRAAQAALKAERDTRAAERKATKAAERAAAAETQRVLAAERAALKAAEEKRLEAEAVAKAQLEAEAAAKRKEIRDAKYAARKARKAR